MISARNTPEGNAQRSKEALTFAQMFFQRQDKERTSLPEMYHDQATLNWNAQSHKSRTSITKFYQAQKSIETTLQALDAQIMPQMGDIVDMITVIAGGTIKFNNTNYNFSRVFLLGPNAPGSAEYLIVSDTLRLQE